MNIDFLRRLLLFVVLLLVQALVLNHIHLFDYATPLLYVYFVVTFERNYPRWGILVWSFMLGLSLDVFANTPGLAAFSMTFLGLLQPYVLELFIQRDNDALICPSIASLGWSKFIFFVLLLTLAYSLVFFTVETFSFFNWVQWGLSVLGSTVLTVILIPVVDNMNKSK